MAVAQVVVADQLEEFVELAPVVTAMRVIHLHMEQTQQLDSILRLVNSQLKLDL